MNILVIGSGAREHALAWKLRQSPQVGELFVAPGNAGTSHMARNLQIKVSDLEGLAQAAQEYRIDLAVVGPEGPLAEGIVDLFQERGIPAFGPSKTAAEIETSKVFAKDLMHKYGIPCAESRSFSSFGEALAYVRQQPVPIVVKADGLAAGKGSIVCQTYEEASKALFDIMQAKAFGAAGDRVVIEECLEGPEVSLLAFTDGETVVPMVPACDYKRAYDNDQGPNTGGMGCYSPPSFFGPEMVERAIESILLPTVRALAQEGRPYKGVLYAGLMLTKDGPKNLEFNARFGDPETQVILPRLKTDLVDVLMAVVNGTLGRMSIEWSAEACVGVVLASGGYPGSYATGLPLEGLEAVDSEAVVFHAGTKLAEGAVVTDGGRVLTVAALGKDLAEAREKVYRNISKIRFYGGFYRRDIAAREVG